MGLLGTEAIVRLGAGHASPAAAAALRALADALVEAAELAEAYDADPDAFNQREQANRDGRPLTVARAAARGPVPGRATSDRQHAGRAAAATASTRPAHTRKAKPLMHQPSNHTTPRRGGQPAGRGPGTHLADHPQPPPRGPRGRRWWSPPAPKASGSTWATSPPTAGRSTAPTATRSWSAAKASSAAPLDVLGTLLHEAAHGLAQARGIQDTSRQGRYHNRRYATLARELGLEVTSVQPIGWSATTVPDPTAAPTPASSRTSPPRWCCGAARSTASAPAPAPATCSPPPAAAAAASGSPRRRSPRRRSSAPPASSPSSPQTPTTRTFDDLTRQLGRSRS